MLTEQQVVEQAEDLLSRRLGGSQELSEATRLNGSGTAIVLRARVAPNPFLQQRTVIVKYIPASDDVIDDAALVREVAAYQFTTSLSEDVRPGPVLLAHDVESRLLVLTDSGDGGTFDYLLRQEDPERRTLILRNLGTALGRMHAGTAGKEKAFDTLLARVLRNDPEKMAMQQRRDESIGAAVLVGLEQLEEAGIAVPQQVRSIAEEARHRIMNGKAKAFTPFDLSPDNIIVADRTQFLDYEWAGFREVTFDLACVIAGFPQFVSTHPISDDEADAFVEAWVEEVDEVWPNARNEDLLHERILIALVGWACSTVALMRLGSMSSMIAHAVDGIPIDDLDLVAEQGFAGVLRPAGDGPFTHDELLIRRDFYETFEAMSRFADSGRGDTCALVAEFARTVAHRVKNPSL